jgi:hypothetical protein
MSHIDSLEVVGAGIAVVSQLEGRRNPPASQCDSLVVAGSVEIWRNPPTSHIDSLEVVGAGIVVEVRGKPSNESKRPVGGGSAGGRC